MSKKVQRVVNNDLVKIKKVDRYRVIGPWDHISNLALTTGDSATKLFTSPER